MSLTRNTAANLIGRAFAAVLGIALVPVYLHFLGLEAFALIAVWGLLQGTFSVMDFGFGNAFSRELARLSASPDTVEQQRNLLVTLSAIHWLLAGAAMLVVWVVAPAIASNWVTAENISTDVISTCIRLMGVAVAVQFPIALYQGGLLAIQRQVLYNTLFVATTLVRGVGTIVVLALVSPSIEAFFIWQAFMAGVSAAIHWISLNHALAKSVHGSTFQRLWIVKLWPYAAGSAGNALGIFFAQQFDKIILTKTLPLQQFAYYALAGTFSAVLWTCVSAVGVAAIPRFNRAAGLENPASLGTEYSRAIQLVATVLIPVSVLLLFFTHEVLTLWTSNPEIVSQTEHLVRLFVIGMTLAGLANMTLQIALSYGWFRLTLAFTWTTGLMSMPLYWFASQRWGVIGAGYVYMLQNAAFIFIVPLLHRRYLRGQAMSWMRHALLLPVLAAAATCGLARIVVPTPLHPALLLAMLAFTWIAATLAVAMVQPIIRVRIIEALKKWQAQITRM